MGREFILRRHEVRLEMIKITQLSLLCIETVHFKSVQAVSFKTQEKHNKIKSNLTRFSCFIRRHRELSTTGSLSEMPAWPGQWQVAGRQWKVGFKPTHSDMDVGFPSAVLTSVPHTQPQNHCQYPIRYSQITSQHSHVIKYNHHLHSSLSGFTTPIYC